MRVLLQLFPLIPSASEWGNVLYGNNFLASDEKKSSIDLPINFYHHVTTPFFPSYAHVLDAFPAYGIGDNMYTAADPLS